MSSGSEAGESRGAEKGGQLLMLESEEWGRPGRETGLGQDPVEQGGCLEGTQQSPMMERPCLL